jgi:hypothetical protein
MAMQPDLPQLTGVAPNKNHANVHRTNNGTDSDVTTEQQTEAGQDAGDAMNVEE